MLILQRRIGESLLIGDDIRISVVSIDGGKVRLAINAPGNIPILRNELVVATAANRDSAQEESAPAELLDMLDRVVLHPNRSEHPASTAAVDASGKEG